MVDLDSMDKLRRLFVIWEESFENLLQKIQCEGKVPILVAMSRKMPRLIESMKMDFLGNNFDNYHFVSEHVLPYVLSDIDPKRQCIVIVDDAIYYGSTINHISGYIRAINTNVEVYVCPVAVSEVVGVFAQAEVKRLEENTIQERNIPFFTTQSAVRIIRLSRPIDVEFPIVHFSIPSTSDWKNKMKDVLEGNFRDCEVYEIVHRIGKNDDEDNFFVYNYNVLFPKSAPYDCWNNDFCKLRFFVSDKSVQVAAYAPGILSEAALKDSQPLFSDNRIQALWDDVKTSDTASWPESFSENDSMINIKRDAYKRQCVRSKVVWANYLASFLFLLAQKEAICNIVNEVFGLVQSATISTKDTCLLLPTGKVSSITDKLNQYFQRESKDYGIYYCQPFSVLANQELVPVEYLDDYVESVQRGLQRSRTAEEALSLLFSRQHVFISNGGLTNDALQRTQRLRFGITYTALENKLAFPVGVYGLRKSIHCWIDKNIDEGTVKPKYERVEIDGDAFWLRMFRAGENEDSFTKMRRLCEFVIEKLRQKEYRSYVERDHVENLLTLAWEDPCHIVNHDYKWDTFVKQQNDDVFSLNYQNPSGTQKCFLDILLDQNSLHVIQDSANVSRVSTLDDRPIVTMLAAEQEQAIAEYVDAYWYYAKIRKQPNIMNNFFPQTGESAFVEHFDKLVSWNQRFVEFMHSVAFSESDIKVQQEEFNGFEEEFNHMILQTIKVSDFTDREQVNDNRRKIEKVLRAADTDEYIRFKKELLSAAVVKELFEQLFLEPEEKDSFTMLEGYLSLIQEDEEDGDVIRDYIRMDDVEREKDGKRGEVICALQDILQRDIK